MSLLSDDAVAALVEAAREGQALEELPLDVAQPGRRARTPTIRVVDFRRTVKFKVEHQERLKRAADTFCRVAGTRLTSELRAHAELELMQVEQGMYSRVHAELTPSSLCAVIASSPDRPPLVLAVEQPLVLEAVDRLLGSDGRADVVDRALTDVDRLIARRFFTTLTYCLGQAWKELCGEELELQRTMSYEQVSDVAAIEEPTLVLTIEAKLDAVSTVLALLVPFNAIGALLTRMRSAPAPDPGTGEALAANLCDIGIELRAEVGSIELTTDEVLALKPGDVLELETPAAGGVLLYADTTPVAPARPGRNGRRRAAQVDSTLEVRR
jgi:flagellar motor switch protein FliM